MNDASCHPAPHRLPRLLLLTVLLAIARAPAQTLDSALNPNANGDVYAVTTQADGRILLGGNFSSLGGISRSRLARLNADGSVDSTFNPVVSSTVFVVRPQSDGKILVGGSFLSVGGVSHPRIVRLNADGSVDQAFTTTTDTGYVAEIAIQADGKILLGGSFGLVNGTPRAAIARLNTDGSLDPTFDAAISGLFVTSQVEIDSIALQSDGRILIAGGFANVGAQIRNGAARLIQDGSVEPTFKPLPSSSCRAIAVQPDGKILLGGGYSRLGGTTVRNGLARFNPDGSIDAAFTTGVDAVVNCLAVQRDGKILLGGNFTTVGAFSRSRLARLNLDGTVDPDFDPNVTGSNAIGNGTPSVYALSVPGSAQIVLGGIFSTVSGQPRSGIARLGSPLPTIAAQPVSIVAAAGASASLGVSAVGDGLTYQWKLNGIAVPGATNATLPLPSAQSADAGDYLVVVTNAFGSVISNSARLSLGTAIDGALTITSPPASVHAAAGAPASLTVTASGSTLTYQWRKDGIAVSGATGATYTIPSAASSHMGTYTVVVGSGGSTLESAPALLTVTTPGTASRLTNVSTRGLVQPGGALTPGFVLRGSGTKRLVVRAVGPTLTRFGVAGVLADPRLELIPSGASAAILANDDWSAGADPTGLTNAATANGAFALDASSKDAAMLASVSTTAGVGYTVRIVGPDPAATGIALAEVYDADPASAPVQLINVSTRGFVGTGANALVPGFVIGGDAPKQLLIRAVGPSLAPFGVTGVLADPQLAVVPLGKSAPIVSNDNWSGTATLAAAFAQVGAFTLPSDSKDAAVLVWLPPGGYSVVVSGVANTTGNALIEIYDVQ